MCNRKKWLSWFFAAMLLFALTACRNPDETSSGGKASSSAGGSGSSAVGSAPESGASSGDEASDQSGAQESSSSTSDEASGEDPSPAPEDPESPEEIVNFLTVKNGSAPVNQTFMGFGVVYYPWIYQNDSLGRNYTEQQRQIELDRLVDSGVTWIRCVIYARPEWYNQSTDTWTISGTYFENLLKFFEQIKKRGIEIMLNYEWGATLNTVSNGKVTAKIFSDHALGAIGDKDKRIAMYGNFVAAFTKAVFDAGYENTAKYVTFFSEPANTKETGGFYGDPQFTAIYVNQIAPLFADAVQSADKALKNINLRGKVRFIGANQSMFFNYTGGIIHEQLKPIYNLSRNWLDQVSYHFYNRFDQGLSYMSKSYDGFNTWTELHTQEIKNELGISPNDTWFDEFNITGDTRIQNNRTHAWTATQMANSLLSFMNNGYKTACIWTFTDNLWPGNTQTSTEFQKGVFVCGMMPNLMTSQVPFKTYYGFALVSKYVKDANTVYLGDHYSADGLALTAAKSAKGDWTIIVVSTNSTDETFRLDFEKSLGKATLYRHTYNPQTHKSTTAAAVPGVNKTMSGVTTGFTDSIPPGGITVYTTIKG